ncbi:MAG TPA: hypothetical protein VK601_07145, partial [Kofleriaceae bacterium]|nr:hypothetical protein [Kofleriaceae bacterium]
PPSAPPVVADQIADPSAAPTSGKSGPGKPGAGKPGPGKPGKPAPGKPGPGGAGSDKPGMGETCGAGDACAPGLTCVAYYGFAGPRGPQFKSCEIRCTDDSSCPKGRTCVTVSDGPGRVCRSL